MNCNYSKRHNKFLLPVPAKALYGSFYRTENEIFNVVNYKLICHSLASKISSITTMEAAPASLTERLFSYMRYKCADETLRGIEQAAFHLHCSARHLQRILNQNESAGLVKKLGKGTYKLIQPTS